MSLKVIDFLELEAEEGSDNEDHDDCVKKKSDPLEEDEDENPNLEELINDYLPNKKLARDQKELRKKFTEEEMKKDREEIKNVINENYKNRKKRKWEEVEKECSNYTQSEGNALSQDKNYFLLSQCDDISKRKKLMRSMLIPESIDSQSSSSSFGNLSNFFKNKNKIINLSKCRRLLSGQHDEALEGEDTLAEKNSDDEENKEMLYKLEKEIKHKISENSSGFKRKFKDRLKENTKIMENVIDLNKINPPKEKIKIEDTKKNNFLPFKYSQSSQNSVLNAIKNDKYYPSNNTLVSQKINENLAKQPNQKNFSVFNNKNNAPLDSEKKQKISAIFDKSERTKIIKINDYKTEGEGSNLEKNIKE